MTRDLRQSIIDCLRVSGPMEGHLKRLREFPLRDWEASLDWLNLSGLALVFIDRLQKLGEEDVVPPRVRAILVENLAENCRRVAAMVPEFDFLNRQFERAGVEFVVWKGFALIPDYCRAACLRPSYDYDYLVSEESWERAQATLETAGYLRKAEPGPPSAVRRAFAKSDRNNGPQGGPLLDLTYIPRHFPARLARSPVALYVASLPRKVELHRSPWANKTPGISPLVPENFLARKALRTCEGVSFYSAAEPEAFMFQALHAFQHMLHNWCRLGWLWEIAGFLERQQADSSFWMKLFAKLEADAILCEMVVFVIALAARLFHADLPTPIQDRVAGAMRSSVALWLDRYGWACALDNFSKSKVSLLLYREFVSDEAAWREIRNRRLLPLQRPNRVVGTALPAAAAPLPESWEQAWHVMQRLVHHSVRGAEYAWESARWDRLRRAVTSKNLP